MNEGTGVNALSWKRLVSAAAPVACLSLMLSACVVMAFGQGRLGPLWNDLLSFLTGAHGDIARQDASSATVLGEAMAMVLLDIPLVAVASLLAYAVGGLRHGREGHALFQPRAGSSAPGPWMSLLLAPHKMAAFVMFEEIYARWLFLGVLTQIPGLSGPVAFYALFLGGNVAWAAVHVFNHRKGERLLRDTLPIFAGGVACAVMFLRHGLYGAFAAHFVWNLLLMLPGWVAQALKREPLTI